MGIDWTNIEFTKHELILINKICQKRRFCKAHLQEESLLSGVKKNEIGNQKEALGSLVKKGIILRYKAQDRHDYCFPMENYAPALKVLERYSARYEFIDISIFPPSR